MKEIRKIGIIDLGTNSVRFDVQKVGPGNLVKCLHREKQMVRLGEGVFLRGRLDPKAARRTLQALERFKKIAEDLHVNRIVAFGTSTLREVKDSLQFLQTIQKRTGIEVNIISGEEEAKLIASAILCFEPHAKGKFALIDIGGGSTEISVCREDKLLHCVSFPLGAARLQQLFLKKSPPVLRSYSGKSAIDDLRTYIHNVLLSEMTSEDWPKVKRLIGSSGTIKAISRIMKARLGTKIIRRPELVRLVNELSLMTPREILALPGMEPKRVDIILSGAILLEQCMEAFGAKSVYPTNYSLRDGMIMQEVSVLRELKLNSDLDLFPLFARASRLGCQESNLKNLVTNAELLFDRLRPIHKLDLKWKDYLLMATIFRDTGWTISPVAHEQHAYYIVKNVELPVSREWETEFVAQLCLCLEGATPDFSLMNLKPEKKKMARKAFNVLLALLRVGEALGPAHQEKLRLEKISLRNNSVQLTLANQDSSELAKIRLDQRKNLFERVFKRKLLIDPFLEVYISRKAG